MEEKMSRAELKRDAKEKLKGNWGTVIIVIIIVGAITFFCNQAVMSLFGKDIDTEFLGGDTVKMKSLSSPGLLVNVVVSCAIAAFFGLGQSKVFLKVSRSEKPSVEDVFSMGKYFVPAFIAAFVTALFVGLWTLLLIIPGIIASYRYKLYQYVLLDNPDMKAMEVVSRCKEMMVGHKMDLFVLELSFLGWMILGLFTLGLLYLWLTPYMNVTVANFYNDIVGYDGETKETAEVEAEVAE